LLEVTHEVAIIPFNITIN